MRRTWSVDWVLRGVLPALRWGRVGAFFFVCAAALVTLCGGLRVSPRFLPEGAGFKGGQGTYEVRATVDHVEITPIEPSRSGAPRGAPVRIETAAIARDRELYARKATGVTEGSARVEADGRLLIQRGEVVEELRSTEEGVEQSWIFDRRPEGTGELVVRLRVSGQEHTGHTKEGLRFTDPRTGLGVRCGPATWVDARGVRTPVSARYSEGHIELRVAEAALDGSAYPAVLDPVWEAEFGMGALGPLVDDTAIQKAPSIAFGKDSYLVVWADQRGSGAIRGARLSQDGEVLDKTGFTLSKGDVIETAVAYDGESYLVVWCEKSAQDSSFYVHGMLVDLDGKPLGAPVAFKHFAEASYPGGGIAIAYDSFEKSYLVVWGHPEEGIVGMRVTTDQGVPTPGAEIALSKPMTQPGALSVACDGERCLVAWWDTVGGAYGVYGSLVSSNSAVDLAISTDPDGGQSITSPAVSFDGIDHYLVLWENKYTGIRGARVNRIDGAVVDPETPVAKGNNKTSPVLARSEDGRLFAAWMNSLGTIVEWAWVDTKSGIDMGEAMKVPSINKIYVQQRPSLACAGNGTTCAMMRPERIRLDPQPYDYRQEIEAALFHEASNTVLPLAVTRNWVDQGDPAVVSREGSGFMIAWSDVDQEERVVLLPTSDASQNPLDNSKPTLAENETFEPGPSIAWGNDNFLIAWTKRSPSKASIAGKILNQSGASVAEFEIPTNPFVTNSSKPDIVFDGLDYLITWMIPGSKYWVRVARQGVSGEASVVTVHAGGGTTYVGKDAGAPAIAHGGENSLIVWAENDIYATRIGMVNGELTTLDPDGIKVSEPIDKLSSSNLFLSPPDVASDGDGYLVIWRRPELAGGSRIYGSRVSRDGVRLDNSFPISPLKSTDVSCAKVTWDGHSYLVVWQDHEGDKGTMFSTWVSRNGVVSGETEPFEVARTTDWNPESAVASDGAGKSLVAYVRSDLEVEGTHVDVNRIRARYVDNPCMLPDVVECMADTECRSPGECIPHPGADGYTCAPSPPRPDGSACDGGMCFNGECIPDATTAPDIPAASGGTGGAGQSETIGGCGCHIESSSEGGADSISARVALLAAALAVYARRRRAASRSREPATQGAFTPMARRRRRRDSFSVSSAAFSASLSRMWEEKSRSVTESTRFPVALFSHHPAPRV